MKILAIRGKNLASLGGEFSVDLCAPPLSGAGVFAIAGPTGAGKTTLLDAMCLALFDRTPRLSDRGGVKVGAPDEAEAQRIGSQDVRGLLRKCCSSGMAEVDFLGRDAKEYRATWSVHRARGRANGTLQAQGMTLRVIETGESIGRTKSEVLEAIQSRLGLSFEQFRRSALLAQGDFAAFLRAREQDRAELLEQMTGTEIYGRISKLAFERGKLESQKLEDLQRQLGSIPLLPLQEREDLVTEMKLADEEATAAQQRFQTAETVLAWQKQLAQCMEQEREAEQHYENAYGEWESTVVDRNLLERTEDLLKIQPLFTAVQQREQALHQQQVQLSNLNCSVEDLQQRTQEVSTKYLQSQLSRKQQQEEFSAMEQELGRAISLDAELSTMSRHFKEGADEVASLQASREAAIANVDKFKELLDLLQRERLSVENSLQALHHVQLVAEEWPRWRSCLQRYLILSRELAAQDYNKKLNLLTTMQAQETDYLQVLVAQKERFFHAEIRAQEAEKKATSFDATALRQRQRTLLEKRETLSQLLQTTKEIRELMKVQRSCTETIDSTKVEKESWAEIARQSAYQRELLEASLREAELSLHRMRIELDLSEHRSLLTPEEPCPLCGSLEHPWANGAPQGDRLIQKQQERVELLREDGRNKDRKETNAKGKLRELQTRIEQEGQRLEKVHLQLEELKLYWNNLRSKLGEDLGSLSPDEERSWATLKDQERAVEVAQQELQAEEQRMDAVLREVTQARKVLDAQRVELDAARSKSEEKSKEIEVTKRELQHVKKVIDERRMEQDTLLQELTPAFVHWDGWQDRLIENIRVFGQLCRDEVERFNSRKEELHRIDVDMDRNKIECTNAKNIAENCKKSLSNIEQKQSALEKQIKELQEQRMQTLGGGSPEQLRVEWQHRIQEAYVQEQSAAEIHNTLVRELALQLSKQREGMERIQGLQDELGAMNAQLTSSLELLRTSREELHSLEGRDVWARGERQRQDERKKNLIHTKLIFEDRQLRRKQLEQAGDTMENAATVAEEAKKVLASAKERLSLAKVRLEKDDVQKEYNRAVSEEIHVQQKVVSTWGSLSSLIGSADGKKFRVFAQSLTFDSLMDLANFHLTTLTRRYQLMRVPGTDLDLQIIDREMADEVRSTASLSGGESFLISLALALALSSLGSRETRVETLFIDEGFGTLDMDTLEVALAALDALQGTGCQVGLISHIPELVERLGAHVRVQPQGAGRSVVRVSAG